MQTIALVDYRDKGRWSGNIRFTFGYSKNAKLPPWRMKSRPLSVRQRLARRGCRQPRMPAQIQRASGNSLRPISTKPGVLSTQARSTSPRQVELPMLEQILILIEPFLRCDGFSQCSYLRIEILNCIRCEIRSRNLPGTCDCLKSY